VTLSIDQIAQRCDKVKWQGQDSFKACCVAHDDRNPSMTVTEAPDGTILVHCFAGCDQRSVLEGLGLWGDKAVSRSETVKPTRPNVSIKKEALPRTYDYAVEIWGSATPVDADLASHPYAIRKRITHAFGARRGAVSGSLIGRGADCIIVPNRDWYGQMVGVECINGDGVKQTFGSKGLLVLGYPEGAPLVHVCEGWATAWALSQLFPDQFGCIVAFGKGRLGLYSKEAQIRFRGIVAVHEEANKRDVWDLWVAGEGEKYAQRTRRAAHV